MSILAHSPGGGVFDEREWREQLRLAVCLHRVTQHLERLGAISPTALPLQDEARQLVLDIADALNLNLRAPEVQHDQH